MATASPPSVPKPMLATLGVPPTGAQFATEFKWDGFRGMVRARGSAVGVYTRIGAEALSTFPELAEVPAGLGQDVILDGEIVALDASGRPSFTRLQRRWPMRRRPSATLMREVPVRLFAFDVIAIGNDAVTDRPYSERRRLLDELAAASTSDVLVVPPSYHGVDPGDMLAAAADNGVEGIVSKRVDSLNVPGRSKNWVKAPLRPSCELAIVGWWPPGGASRQGRIGSLMLAGRGPDGEWHVVGQVGSGFSDPERRRLYELLAGVASARPTVNDASEVTRGVHWVTAVYAGEVAFREYVPGRGLRHASWKGLRQSGIGTIGMPPGA